MSKIKVNEIESSSTNVKLAAKGSGVVKVKGAGGSDGTLQLNSGTHSVKIKSPAHSAQQSYTMILPDNNIETGKFLKVKSVTGSGNTATGQLEYATISEPDRANLNASAFTSGTVPAARFGTPMPATAAGLKLVSKTVVGATPVAQIEITGLQSDKKYLVIGKRITQDNNSADYIQFYPMSDSQSGNYMYVSGVEQYAPSSGGTLDYVRITGSYPIYLRPAATAQTWHRTMGFIMEINNRGEGRGSIFTRAMHCGNYSTSDPNNWYEGFHNGYYQGSYWKIDSLMFYPRNYGSWNFTQDSTILLYEYGE